ncbi:MAG: rnz [Chlamydiales bacterium]|jgi:ribonuclease Z|nr:rnz [Chlamydiales bacterium]
MSTRELVILGCSSQQPTRYRNHGAYLLRWNNEGFLFDPGEGTQRQFIHAEVAPTEVNRIFISHFHGDHSLGVGSMLLRLNLDKVQHEIHCYYPASGKKYFDRLRYSTIYHETIKVVEHPISEEGIIENDGKFKIEAYYLDHGVDNLAWRITETDRLKFDQDKLDSLGIKGPIIRELRDRGQIEVGGKLIHLEDVSWIRRGDTFAIVLDTRYCANAIKAAQGAKLLLCESTYLEEHAGLANRYCHLTAKQAATIAKEAQVEKLILTHFSARYASLKGFEEEARTVFPNSFAAKDLKVFDFPL